MERLTERGKRGINADIIGIDISDMCIDLTIYKIGILESALNRLAAYEDSGLTPEEVMELAKIVHCKDCKYRHYSGEVGKYLCFQHWCHRCLRYIEVNECGFCDKGKMK